MLLHPNLLTGYIKSNIMNGNTATIRIYLYSGNNIVDSRNLYRTNSNFRKVRIPISRTSFTVDFALIQIFGGKTSGTELTVDNLAFIKNNNKCQTQ